MFENNKTENSDLVCFTHCTLSRIFSRYFLADSDLTSIVLQVVISRATSEQVVILFLSAWGLVANVPWCIWSADFCTNPKWRT